MPSSLHLKEKKNSDLDKKSKACMKSYNKRSRIENQPPLNFASFAVSIQKLKSMNCSIYRQMVEFLENLILSDFCGSKCLTHSQGAYSFQKLNVSY